MGLDSELRFYSLGMVAEDKLMDDQYIKVYPMEKLPTLSGDPIDNTAIKTSTTDANDGVKSTAINRGSVIKAKWMALGEYNRVSSPDVMKGETVLLWKFGGADKYFWTSMYSENRLRKREKVVWIFSNKKNIGPLDKNYYVMIDTYGKYVRLHTDDTDGEFTTFDIEIDTKEGILVIQDGQGNEFTLTAQDDKWLLKTNKKIVLTTIDHETNNTRTTNNIGDKKVEKIGDRYSIALKHLDITNGSDEIVALISELIQAIIDEQHVGNLGIDTVLNGASIAKFSDIKSRFEAFM